MHFAACLSLLAASLKLLTPASAAEINKRYTAERYGIEYNVFEHARTGSKLEYVFNSGICETTPGVKQISGYFDVGEGINMFFWFFESRHNPKKAPLVSWHQGGPGASSLVGLFSENGPCQFYNNATEPSLNQYSFNEYANMIYIDQPSGVGFSYGSPCCNSTETAAVYIWNLIQAFYDAFPEYESHDYGMFGESYGGRYVPLFANHVLDQNNGIKNGTVNGVHINLKTIGINDGIYDAKIWYRGLIEYAHDNPYRQLANSSMVDAYLSNFTAGCLPALDVCYDTGTDDDCYNAFDICSSQSGAYWLLTMNDWDFQTYDIRLPVDVVVPPETFIDYLARPEIQRKIGARVAFMEINDDVFTNITSTGDYVRPSARVLPSVLEAGVNVLLWAGDADVICNWISNLHEADSIQWPKQGEFNSTDLGPYLVNGTAKGEFKTVDNFSYIRVYGAGHMVMYYEPEASLQIFKQMLSDGSPSST